MDQPITNTQLPVEPPTTPPEQLPQITPKKSPITSIIIGLVFVTLVGVAGYFAYQYFMLKNQLAVAPAPTPSPTIETTDPTANWKTYEYHNNGLNFSFRYPMEYSIQDEPRLGWGDSSLKELRELAIEIAPPNDQKHLQLVVLASKTTRPLSEYVKDHASSNGPTPISHIQNSLSVTEYIGSYKNPPTHYLSFLNDGYIYSAGLVDIENVFTFDSENSLLLNQILSTFKFTSRAEKTSSTQNWKTFTNQEIGFSFKYPQSWTESNVGNNKGITLRTTEPSREKRDGKTINYSFEVIMGENEESYNILKANTIKVLSPKNIEGKTFERYIVGDMYLSLNYIFESDAGNKIRFMLFPYGNTADEPVEQFAEIEQTIDQILSTFKFSEE